MMTKPFPWKCSRCRERAVAPATVAYTATLEHDGRPYDVRVSDLRVPRCDKCGKLVMTDEANLRITEALRAEAKLLAPAAIRHQREALGLTQKQLAARLGVAEATLSRWETGGQIQQRAMDRLLRLFFAFANVRAALADDRTYTELGLNGAASSGKKASAAVRQD
jgi:putative zinc finger/helix-turn-helix YgiT family protein